VPSAGGVRVYTIGAAEAVLDLLGAGAGDQLGASVALGRVVGGAPLHLVVGAPAAAGGAGRVYLVPVPTGGAATRRLSWLRRLRGRRAKRQRR
jgi:hypothetical protein